MKRRAIQIDAEISALLPPHHCRDALEAIRSYQSPRGESPSQTVDVLQDMAARALGAMEAKKRKADEG